MAEPIVILCTFIALQSSHTWFAFAASRLVVTNCIFTARLIATAWQTTGRQRIKSGRTLIAEPAQNVRFAATLAGLFVADCRQGSIDVAAAFWGREKEEEVG